MCKKLLINKLSSFLLFNKVELPVVLIGNLVKFMCETFLWRFSKLLHVKFAIFVSVAHKRNKFNRAKNEKVESSFSLWIFVSWIKVTKEVSREEKDMKSMSDCYIVRAFWQSADCNQVSVINLEWNVSNPCSSDISPTNFSFLITRCPLRLLSSFIFTPKPFRDSVQF